MPGLPQWNDHLFRSPLFAALAPAAALLRGDTAWPERGELNALLAARGVVSGGGQALRLVSSKPEVSEPGYESRVFLTGELATRECNWHDLLNALVWLSFPLAKAALNARHHEAVLNPMRSAGSADGVGCGAASGARGAERDALTLFDESGVAVVSSDPSLLGLVKAFAWKELFWRRREDVLARMAVFVFGHGLYEQALQPFIGMTGKALLFEVDATFFEAASADQLVMLDRLLGGLIRSPGSLLQPRQLAPLPVLGMPGWAAENGAERYYDNEDYFRPGRTRRS